MKKIIIILLAVFTSSCVAQKTEYNAKPANCKLDRLTLPKSKFRQFLNSTSEYRDVAERFLQDFSDYAVLVIKNENTILALCNKNIWTVSVNDHPPVKKELESQPIQSYAGLNAVDALQCSKKTQTTNVKSSIFHVIWIKKNGILTYQFYSLDCDMCITDKEKEYINPLLEFIDVLSK